jgi:hypothetical protein
MESRATEMVNDRKYRVVTGWGEEIMTFWGIMEENGNPLFVKKRVSHSTDSLGGDRGSGVVGIKGISEQPLPRCGLIYRGIQGSPKPA